MQGNKIEVKKKNKDQFYQQPSARFSKQKLIPSFVEHYSEAKYQRKYCRWDSYDIP